MPMIKLVYYFPPNTMQPGTETLLRTATLLGAIVGQVTFGLLAGQSECFSKILKSVDNVEESSQSDSWQEFRRLDSFVLLAERRLTGHRSLWSPEDVRNRVIYHHRLDSRHCHVI